MHLASTSPIGRRRSGRASSRVLSRAAFSTADPLAAPAVASVKLDLSANELLARVPERRPIAHPYEPDEALPDPADVACYVFEEVFAEKLRAMGERSRPRDLYDIVNLYRRDDLRLRRDDIHAILVEKCAHKDIEVPMLASIEASGLVPELESGWENMLGHQLPVLPPFAQFWDALEDLFGWLEGAEIAPALAPLAAAADEDPLWTPLAAVNHLCVELSCQSSRTRSTPSRPAASRAGSRGCSRAKPWSCWEPRPAAPPTQRPSANSVGPCATRPGGRASSRPTRHRRPRHPSRDRPRPRTSVARARRLDDAGLRAAGALIHPSTRRHSRYPATLSQAEVDAIRAEVRQRLGDPAGPFRRPARPWFAKGIA